MDEEKLKKAAGLLKEASDMLLTVEKSTSNSSGTYSSTFEYTITLQVIRVQLDRQ